MELLEKIDLAERPQVDYQLQHEIEQFLYAESELLDDRKYQEWYQLMADDIHYVMPIVNNVMPDHQRDERGAGVGGYIMHETKHRLAVRVRKLMNGRDVVEHPYSLMRRMLSNVRVTPLTDGSYSVRVCFNITRVRNDNNVDLYTGEREDVIKRANNAYGWEVSKRLINLDHTLQRGGGIGFLF